METIQDDLDKLKLLVSAPSANHAIDTIKQADSDRRLSTTRFNDNQAFQCARRSATFKSKTKNCVHLVVRLLLTVFKCLLAGSLLIVISVVLTSFLMNTRLQKIILSYSQELIYPVMRQVRLWSLNLNENDPSWKSLHVEECLLPNPFFVGIQNQDCLPCQNILSVVDLSNNQDHAQEYVHHNKPFVIKEASSLCNNISVQRLSNHIQKYGHLIDFGTASITAENADWPASQVLNSSNIFGLINATTNTKLHVTWRMNRVESIRVLRKLFRRPKFVPQNTEVSLEKYLFVDRLASPAYQIPLTQFANIWLIQLNGARLFSFRPSSACRKKCRPFSILLASGDILYYNWLFWSLVSMPIGEYSSSVGALRPSNITVTYINSFY